MQQSEEHSPMVEDESLEAEDILGDGGILKTILKDGEGYERPANGVEVSVHYTGTLTDGTKFDSSVDRGEYFKFTLGQGNVIKGWDKTVATMKRGEKCRVVLKPEYAYGAKGSPPTIPPNATLIFEIELFEFSNSRDESKHKDGSVLKTTIEPSPEASNIDKPDFDSNCTINFSVESNGQVLVDGIERSITIGDGQFPKGVEVAIKSMVVGEKSRFVIQPHCAYGGQGCEALNIPPNSVTVWTINLTKLEKATPSWKLGKEEKIQAAAKGKEIGNELFSRGAYAMAIKRYKNAISFIEYLGKDGDSDGAKQLLISLQLNLSQCYLKTKHGKCVSYLDKVLKSDPNNIKGLYRHGLAMCASKDWDIAKTDFERVLQLDSSNATAKLQLRNVAKQIRDQDERDRAIYSNMLK